VEFKGRKNSALSHQPSQSSAGEVRYLISLFVAIRFAKALQETRLLVCQVVKIPLWIWVDLKLAVKRNGLGATRVARTLFGILPTAAQQWLNTTKP